MKRFLVFIIAVICFTQLSINGQTVDKTGVYSFTIAKSPGTVWNKVLDYVMMKEIDIKTMDKNSFFIISDGFHCPIEITPEEGANIETNEGNGFLKLGTKTSQNIYNWHGVGKFYVCIRPSGNGSILKVKFSCVDMYLESYTGSRKFGGFDGTSTGLFEKGLYEFLK